HRGQAVPLAPWPRLCRGRGTLAQSPTHGVRQSGVILGADSQWVACQSIHGRKLPLVWPSYPPVCSCIIPRVHTVINCLSHGALWKYASLKRLSFFGSCFEGFSA